MWFYHTYIFDIETHNISIFTFLWILWILNSQNSFMELIGIPKVLHLLKKDKSHYGVWIFKYFFISSNQALRCYKCCQYVDIACFCFLTHRSIHVYVRQLRNQMRSCWDKPLLLLSCKRDLAIVCKPYMCPFNFWLSAIEYRVAFEKKKSWVLIKENMFLFSVVPNENLIEVTESEICKAEG